MKTLKTPLSLLGFTFTIFSLLLLFGGCSADRDDPASPTSPLTTNADKAVQRSFEEFLAAQGTYCWDDGAGGCFYLEPPLGNLPIWVSPENLDIIGWFDYAGLADAWLMEETDGAMTLGTEVSGSVSERTLPDGRALIKVNIHAQNALALVMEGVQGPLLFGERITDVLDGATPALGPVHLNTEIIVAEPGAPLPDLFQVWFFPEEGQEVLRLTFNANATGDLHDGSGYPEGTYGRANCVQVGLFQHVPPGNQHWDGYPVETLTLRPFGP